MPFCQLFSERTLTAGHDADAEELVVVQNPLTASLVLNRNLSWRIFTLVEVAGLEVPLCGN